MLFFGSRVPREEQITLVGNVVSLGVVAVDRSSLRRAGSRQALLIHVVRASDRDSASRMVREQLQRAYRKRLGVESFATVMPFGSLSRGVRRACRKLETGDNVELDLHVFDESTFTQEAWDRLLDHSLTKARRK